MARFDWTSRKVWAVPAVWSYLLLSFEGRIPRLPFWIAAAALNVVAYLADRVALTLGGNPAAAVVGLAFLIPRWRSPSNAPTTAAIPTSTCSSCSFPPSS